MCLAQDILAHANLFLHDGFRFEIKYELQHIAALVFNRTDLKENIIMNEMSAFPVNNHI